MTILKKLSARLWRAYHRINTSIPRAPVNPEIPFLWDPAVYSPPFPIRPRCVTTLEGKRRAPGTGTVDPSRSLAACRLACADCPKPQLRTREMPKPLPPPALSNPQLLGIKKDRNWLACCVPQTISHRLPNGQMSFVGPFFISIFFFFCLPVLELFVVAGMWLFFFSLSIPQ